MTPTTLRAIRKSLALTQDALAGALGVSRRSVVAWEAGEIPVPEPMARVMRLAAQEPGILERLADTSAP